MRKAATIRLTATDSRVVCDDGAVAMVVTRFILVSTLVVCWSCAGTPVTHPTTPTRPSTATQVSVLAPVLSAHLAPAIETMRIGETVTFSIRVELGEGVPPSSGGLPNWSSTNPAAIVIDGSGRATAVGEGQATIEGRGHGRLTTRTIRVTS